MIEKHKNYPPLTAYRITRSDGSSYVTDMAADITLKDASDYFMGQRQYLDASERKSVTVTGVEQVTPPSTNKFPDILTDYRRKPIPTDAFNWVAWYDGYEEAGTAFGITKAEAIEKLKATLEITADGKAQSV
jgi:hypothetical protein